MPITEALNRIITCLLFLLKCILTIIFSPHHLIYDSDIGLDNLYNYARYVFTNVNVDRSTVIVVLIHRNGSIDSLEKRLFVYAREDEACVVERFGALGRGADAYCRERMAD